MIVHQAYRFALAPTPAQARALSARCGAARVAFNWRLALVKAVMETRLSLHIRVYRCGARGRTLDRDLNASRPIGIGVRQVSRIGSLGS